MPLIFPFDRPMLRGTLIKRYKRFLADITLESGETITAHCANSGAMTSCKEPGCPVLLSDSQNPKRKLLYTFEAIQMGETWVGVNTANPNRAVENAVRENLIPELAGYASVKPEVKYGIEGRSRIDLLLRDHPDDPRDCYVEIKNTTMRVDDYAAFPDAVTERGQKHLEELMHVASEGHRAVIFFFMGRADCTRFRPADEVDSRYGELLRQAAQSGVEILPYRMDVQPDGIHLLDRAEYEL